MFDLMNVMVREGEEMAAASWALQSLADRFPPWRERLLDESSQYELRRMAAEHASDLARNLATASAVLTSLDVRLPADPFPAASEASWQVVAQDVHPLSRQGSESLLRFFADGVSSAAAQSSPADSELPALLGELRQRLTALFRLLAPLRP